MHVMQVAGAEMLVAEIIRRLDGRIDPLIVCLDEIGPLGEALRGEGVPVISLGRRPGLDLRAPRALAAALRAHGSEVVHAHQYTPFFYSALAKLASPGRWRLLFTEHGRHYPDVVSPKRRLANRLLLARLADEITAVCEFSAQSLKTLDGFNARTVHVVENGIDLPPERQDSLAQRRQRLGLRADRLYVTCVARFHPVKDHPTLLAAFADVATAIDHVDLLLAGDGPSRPALVALVEQLGIASRVHFLGVRSDVGDLLAASDVFVLSSVSEASSLTLLEAMAAAVPVVITNVGGNPELARAGQEGLLVGRQNPQALAAALVDLLSDEPKRRAFGQSGRRRVEEHFRLDRTIARYFDFYQHASRT